MAIIGLLTNFVFKLIERSRKDKIFSRLQKELDKVGGGRKQFCFKTL